MRDYQRLAPFLNGLVAKSDAVVHYDLFADALIWSDELPAPAERSGEILFGNELRGIWHFRTTLILGTPKENIRSAWEEAARCFPNWPGFDPKRRDPNLAAIFLAMQETAMKKWEETENRIEAELASKNLSNGMTSRSKSN